MTTNEAALVEELARLNRTIKSHAKAIASLTKAIDAHFAQPEPTATDVVVTVPVASYLTLSEIKGLPYGARVVDNDGKTWARGYLDTWLRLDAPGVSDSSTLEVLYGPITLAAK